MTQAPERPAPTVAWPGHDNTLVPYRVYTDPAVHAAEQDRIFEGPSWNFVCLAAELPAPGTFVRSQVGERPVIVTRDRDGALHCVVNRCSHRGVMFCQQDSGVAAKLTCPYHQWVYRLDGRLSGVPFRRGVAGRGGMPDDFRAEDHGLPTLRVAERGGAVFASFGEPPPLDEYLGATTAEHFDRVFDGRELTVLGRVRQRIAGNWKLPVENIKDPYHAATLHAFFVTFGIVRADQPISVLMDATGRHCTLVTHRGERAATGETTLVSTYRRDVELADPSLLDAVPEFGDDAGAVQQTIWPNLVVSRLANSLATKQILPRGPGEHDMVWTFFGYADDPPELRERRLLQANLVGPAGFVSVDDGEVMEQAQEGMNAFPEHAGLLLMDGAGDVADSDHGVTEVAIRAFYRAYREVMGL